MEGPNLLPSVLKNKCPRCRKGDLFKNKNPYRFKKLFAMYDRCPVCGQKTEIEVGFWFGTGYVSYGLCVMLSMITFALYWIFIGITWRDNSIFHWLIANTILLVLIMPWLIRLSRVIYLYLFVRYDPGTASN